MPTPTQAVQKGVLFTTLVLITGPIWAKPVWGIWWTWDARLTLTLVLWFIYMGYLMLRRYVESPERGWRGLGAGPEDGRDAVGVDGGVPSAVYRALPAPRGARAHARGSRLDSGQPGRGEIMTWVFAAFAAVWIAVFIFIVRLGRAQHALSDEIAALKAKR